MKILLGVAVVSDKPRPEPVNRIHQAVVDAVRTLRVVVDDNAETFRVIKPTGVATEQEVLVVDHATDNTEALRFGGSPPMMECLIRADRKTDIVFMRKGPGGIMEVCVGEY